METSCVLESRKDPSEPRDREDETPFGNTSFLVVGDQIYRNICASRKKKMPSVQGRTRLFRNPCGNKSEINHVFYGGNPEKKGNQGKKVIDNP